MPEAVRPTELPLRLYRGVNRSMHERNEGRLAPKGQAWAWQLFHNGSAHYGDGSTYGRSAANAVVRHQEDSSQFRTAWVSFTPHEEVAAGYGLYGGEADALVYVVNTALLEQHGVVAMRVADVATWPTKPGDDEIVLRAATGGPLPVEIIVEVREVRAATTG